MASKDKKKPSTSRTGGAGGIRTLADLNRRPTHDSDDSDSDVPQEYYTGGEKSWKGKGNLSEYNSSARLDACENGMDGVMVNEVIDRFDLAAQN